jgi:hypothetical protein
VFFTVTATCASAIVVERAGAASDAEPAWCPNPTTLVVPRATLWLVAARPAATRMPRTPQEKAFSLSLLIGLS